MVISCAGSRRLAVALFPATRVSPSCDAGVMTCISAKSPDRRGPFASANGTSGSLGASIAAAVSTGFAGAAPAGASAVIVLAVPVSVGPVSGVMVSVMTA